MANDAFDVLAQENSGSELIVSLIGLPVNVTRSGIWQNPEKPRFALLLPDWRFVGEADAIRNAIKSGKIVAAVINKPDAPGETVPLHGDYKTEFDKRYLLVTEESIDRLLQVNPRLF